MARVAVPAPNPGRDLTAALLAERWATCGPSDVLEFYGHSAKAGSNACYSNFYNLGGNPFSFEIPHALCALPLSDEERTVPCSFSESAIMLCKAAVMGDRQRFLEIRACKTPGQAKILGRKVQNFDAALWDRVVCSVAFEAVFQKFSKTARLRAVLLATGSRLIAEATKRDRIWGIGVDVGSPQARDPSQWDGANILGWALMEARNAIRGEGIPSDLASYDELGSAISLFLMRKALAAAEQEAGPTRMGFEAALATAYASALTKLDSLAAQFSCGATVPMVVRLIEAEVQQDEDFSPRIAWPVNLERMSKFLHAQVGREYGEWKKGAAARSVA